MKRLLLCLVAAVVASFSLSACGVTGDPDAATVGSTAISRSQLDDELQTIADNKVLAKTLSSQGLELVPSKGTVSPAITAGWLSALVNQVFVDRVFAEKDLTVSAANKTAAKTQAEQIFGGAEAFNAFPKEFQDTVLRRQERIEAVRESLPREQGANESALREFFESTKDQFCPSGTVIAHIQVATRAEADAVAGELAGGADFATVAADRSTDQGSADTGGLVACTDSQQFGQLPDAFRFAAGATPVGAVSPPVQTEAGFHVIKVAPWDFATARPVIEQAYAQQQGQSGPYEKFLNRRLARAKLWVDPRYGRVRRSRQGVAIEPRTPPAPQSRPTTTTQPGTGQPSTGQPSTGQPQTPTP